MIENNKNETYFAMSLAQIMNPVTIKYDAPEPQWNHLEFLCNRFSAQKLKVNPESTSQEAKKEQFDFLMSLQENAKKDRDNL